MEGMSLASGRPWFANAFFLVYYVFVVVVLVNLLIAYVVDRYHEQHRLDHLLEQLLSIGAEDDEVVGDVRHCFEHFASADSSKLSEEAPEMQTSDQCVSSKVLRLTQVPEVLKALNCSPRQGLQLNSSAIQTFETTATKLAGDRGVLCLEEFMEAMVETQKVQYETEQMILCRTNRTL